MVGNENSVREQLSENSKDRIAQSEVDFENGRYDDLNTGDGEHCTACDNVTLYGYGPLVPVWKDVEAFKRGEEPDYIGCVECHIMRPFSEWSA